MNNVAFTIDEIECKLKVMFAKNKEIEYKEYGFTSDCIKDSVVDYKKVFAQTLDEFVAQENIYPATAVYVMPDKYAFFDHIETPAMSGKKLNDMLNLEISTRYKQKNNYKTIYVPLSNQGGKAATIAFMVRNDQISEVGNALKAYKFTSRLITIESAMISNAFLTLKPLNRRGSVLFAYILDNETKITVIKDSKLIAFSTIPYGKDLYDLEDKLKSAPAVLTTNERIENNKTIFDCVVNTDPKNNYKYLLRAVLEMRDILSEKYNIKDIAMKYNVANIDTALFSDYKDIFGDHKEIERVQSKKHILTEHLELYGALEPKIYDKGLLF